MKNISKLFLALEFVLFAGLAQTQAQWTTVDLYPANATGDSQVIGVFANEQAGFSYDTNGAPVASVWHGSAASFINNGSGLMTATDGTQQVGWSQQSGGGVFAARWLNGTLSFLAKPSGADSSGAYAISGKSYGGFYTISGGPPLAFFWIKSNKGVSLHPAGHAASLVEGVSGNMQAGRDCPVSQFECFAAVWRGRASTLRTMHPSGFVDSNIRGLEGNIGVGWATDGFGRMHAGFWNITNGTFTDVHDASKFASGMNGVSNNCGAGVVWQSSADDAHAMVWDLLNSNNNVDLHSLLPSGQYTSSAAFCIWRNNAGTTYVGGMAVSASDGVQHAMLWILS